MQSSRASEGFKKPSSNSTDNVSHKKISEETIAKQGSLLKKGTFSTWKKHYYVLENGLLMEFKKEGVSKPLTVIRLKDCKVQEAQNLIGEANSIAIFTSQKNPMFLKTETNTQMIEWLSALSTHSNSNEIVWKSSLADAFNDPVVITSSNGVIVEVNKHALELFGYTQSEMIGRNVKILIPPEIAQFHDAYIHRYNTTGHSNLIGKPRVLEAVKANGERITVKLSLGIDHSIQGEIRFIGTIRSEVEASNVTKESVSSFLTNNVDKIMNEATQELKETLENQIKDVFEQLDSYKAKCKQLMMQPSQKKLGNVIPNNSLVNSSSIENSESTSSNLSNGIITIDTNRVEIHERLGIGGSGAIVYSASVDGWKCAVKELDLSNASEKEITLFESEINVMEKLPYHRNIIRILFHSRTQNKLRIFMTRYKETLASKLTSFANQKKYFNLEKIAKLSLDIVKGLIFLHENNIIHRDLKSDNIFINYNNLNEPSYLSIGDFDRAKMIESESAKTTVGTVSWLAPEVLNSGNTKEYTFSADVWSFGMVMFEMMTNCKPYFNISQVEIYKAISTGKIPTFPKDMGEQESVVKVLTPIWLKCLEFDPKNRISLSELKEKLVHFL